jgi:hypothetical protein
MTSLIGNHKQAKRIISALQGILCVIADFLKTPVFQP